MAKRLFAKTVNKLVAQRLETSAQLISALEIGASIKFVINKTNFKM